MLEASFLKTKPPFIYMAKAVAITAIVLGNILVSGPVQRLCFAFHIPLFFVVAGFSFDRKENYSAFLIDRIKKLLVPYFAFGLIAIAVYLLLNNSAFSFWDLALQLLMGTAKEGVSGGTYTERLVFYPALWFLPALFICENITYFTDKIMSKKRQNIIGFVLIFFFCTLSFFNIYFFKIPALPFCIDNASGLMPFMLLGRLIANNPNLYGHIKSPSQLFIWSILTLVTGAFFALSKSTVSYPNETFGGSVFDGFSVLTERVIPDTFGMYMISASLLCFGILGLCLFVSRLKLAEYIGQNTMCIFLLHQYFVLAFKNHIPFTANVLNGSGTVFAEAVKILMAIVLSAFIIIICLIIGEFIKKFIPFLFGECYKKQTEVIRNEGQTK